MVRFPKELMDVLVTPATTKVPKAITLPPTPKKDVSPTPEKEDGPPPVNKMSLCHVMNLITLGEFSNEIEFHDQEMIVDKILELCQFYNLTVPSTFKQAMKSLEREEWLKAIAVELNNLEKMRVWALGQLPSGKKELNG
jgi:hypothetical protein